MNEIDEYFGDRMIKKKEILELIDQHKNEVEQTIEEIRECDIENCQYGMDKEEHEQDEVMAVAKKLVLKDLREAVTDSDTGKDGDLQGLGEEVEQP